MFLTLLDAVIGTVLTDVIDNWLPLETIFVMPFSYAFGITYVQEEMRAMAKVVNLAKKIIIIIIMSCHTSRCIRPPCCLTNIFLSHTTALAISQLFQHTFFCSFSTVLLQVGFGFHLALRPSYVPEYVT